MEPPDELLCRRVADKDEVAFDLLVTRYQQRAWRLAWSILRDTEEARDLSQEAFVRLYQTAGSFAGRARFSTWFYRLVVNLCLDHRRRQRWWRRAFSADTASGESGTSLLEREPADLPDPAEALDRERALKQIWDAVEGLSPQQRAAMVLHAQEGLATKDIAAVLACSETTVRVHLHRALRALRRTLPKG